jgi:ABC-2 type transport system permease protein
VLATGVGRLRFAGSHLAFGLLGPAAALCVAGLAAGVVRGAGTGETGRDVGRVLGAAMVQLPAVWVLAAVAVLLVGAVPRWAVASWAALVLCLLVGFIGSGVELNHWLVDVSPFTHVPRLPGAAWSTTPVALLLAAALLLSAAGLTALRRRDIPVG